MRFAEVSFSFLKCTYFSVLVDAFVLLPYHSIDYTLLRNKALHCQSNILNIINYSIKATSHFISSQRNS